MPLPPLPEPKSLAWQTVAFARGALVVAGIVVTALIFNLVQLLCLPLGLVSPGAARAVIRLGGATWWALWTNAARLGAHCDIVLSGDALPPGERALLLVNHQQMADITFLMYLAQRHGRMGDVRWFLKDAIKWFPGVGWGTYLHNNVFVSRHWTRDQASITRTFARLVRARVQLWLIMFPEGTRLSAAKLARGQDFARERGLPPLQHLLVPRTKGFVATVQGLRGHLHAVYDVTVGYEGGVPSLWQYIRGLCRVAHVHVRRFPIEALPEDEAALAEWLHARWREKDQHLQRLYERGAI